jgi:hypothetical protein
LIRPLAASGIKVTMLPAHNTPAEEMKTFRETASMKRLFTPAECIRADVYLAANALIS